MCHLSLYSSSKHHEYPLIFTSAILSNGPTSHTDALSLSTRKRSSPYPCEFWKEPLFLLQFGYLVQSFDLSIPLNSPHTSLLKITLFMEGYPLILIFVPLNFDWLLAILSGRPSQFTCGQHWYQNPGISHRFETHWGLSGQESDTFSYSCLYLFQFKLLLFWTNRSKQESPLIFVDTTFVSLLFTSITLFFPSLLKRKDWTILFYHFNKSY